MGYPQLLLGKTSGTGQAVVGVHWKNRSFPSAPRSYTPATLMRDERAYTLPVVLNGYVGEFSAEWGKFAAGSLIVSVPVTVLFFALQKQLVEGLTAGGREGVNGAVIVDFPDWRP